MDDTDKRWFGIRTITLFGEKNDRTHVYEERVLVFCGKDSDEALAKAEREHTDYCRSLETDGHGWIEAYELDGDALLDGYEVWSQLYESRDDIEVFVKDKYGKYDYTPDP